MTERKTEGKADYIEIKPGDWVVHLAANGGWKEDASEHFQRILWGSYGSFPRRIVAISPVLKVTPKTFVIPGFNRVPREWVAAAFATEAEARTAVGRLAEMVDEADGYIGRAVYRLDARLRQEIFDRNLPEAASLFPDLLWEDA